MYLNTSMHVYDSYYKTLSWNSKNFNEKKKSKKATSTKTKKIFNINDIDVNNILVSKKENYGQYNLLKY